MKSCPSLFVTLCCLVLVVVSASQPAAIAQGQVQLQPGDADQDLDFDQYDQVLVLQAAKYLTSLPATWGEGDWDGAPGGTPGNPPPGSGIYDQLDIIAALIQGVYLTGPYAPRAGAGLGQSFPVSCCGVKGDSQASLIYDPNTGDLTLDAPADRDVTSINIESAAGVFTNRRAENLGGSFDIDTDNTVFKATFGGQFGTVSFGEVAEAGLSYDRVLNDLSAVGSLAGGGGLGDVDLVYLGPTTPFLMPGDADQNLEFNELDLVRVLAGGKYVTGQPATWGEGDWNGGPGGEPGSPPLGDGLFDEFDILDALAAGVYAAGPYAALHSGARLSDARVAVVYDARTGEVSVDASGGPQLTAINIESLAGVFTSEQAANLGGSFDNDVDNRIFKATFGGSFGSTSFGNVAQTGLSKRFMLNDLTATGSLAGGGALGSVDLIYIPEPTSLALAAIGLLGSLFCTFR